MSRDMVGAYGSYTIRWGVGGVVQIYKRPSKDHLDVYKWIKANGQWVYDNFDHCEVETSDDDARLLWSSDDDEHFDPFKDDPTHPEACWSP
nr:hypothetical protein [Tanacetum cinerariifolium]